MNILPLIALSAIVASSNEEFPLDEEVKNSFINSHYEIETTCKVVKTAGTYTYLYSVKNNSKKAIEISWEPLNILLKENTTWKIKPGEHITVSFECPDGPIYSSRKGKISILHLTNGKDFERILKEYLEKPTKVSISNSALYRNISYYTRSPLPKSYGG